MTRLVAIALTLASAMSAAAAPRMAVVRVKDIYAELPSTAQQQQQFKT